MPNHNRNTFNPRTVATYRRRRPNHRSSTKKIIRVARAVLALIIISIRSIKIAPFILDLITQSRNQTVIVDIHTAEKPYEFKNITFSYGPRPPLVWAKSGSDKRDHEPYSSPVASDILSTEKENSENLAEQLTKDNKESTSNGDVATRNVPPVEKSMARKSFWPRSRKAQGSRLSINGENPRKWTRYHTQLPRYPKPQH